MKTCPQCGQTYHEDTNFCLTDGATLISSVAPTVAQIEIPTLIRSSPTVIPVEQPHSTSFQQPFQQPFQQSIPPPVPAASGGGGGFLWVAVGLALLLILGAGIGLGLYFVSGPANNSNETVAELKKDSGASAGGKSTEENDNKRDELDDEKEKLKSDQQKLDAEKRRLEEERKALEAKKKMTPPPTIPPPTDNFRTAYVIDPPSNVRATPNGRVVCVIRGLNTPIRILGSTGVRDSNGLWYITDACGSRAVIHSTQIRF